jgi:alcohol dehydrogenase (cytochrome c)
VASILSRIIFGVGVALAISALLSIYVTSIAQGQPNQNGNNNSPSSAGQNQGGSVQHQNTASSSSAFQASQGAGMSIITIPQDAQAAPPGKAYVPDNAQVSPNSKVTWQNKDSVAHTATAKDKSFDTGIVQAGASASVTIKGQGQIQYSCIIHPTMTGIISVSNSIGSQSTEAQQGNSAQSPQQNNNGGKAATTTSSSATPQASSAQERQLQQNNNNQTTNAEGFTYRKAASAFEVLPKSISTDLGTEVHNKDNWVMTNHDIFGTRSSPQTTIGKDNVKELSPKWILNTGFPIETPPLIVGESGYVENNAMQVIAFDVNTGLNKWVYDPGVADKQTQTIPRGVFSHGITYDKGAIFAPTGANGTVVALNATSGKLIWQSAAIGDPSKGFRLPSPPIVWKDYVIVGSALGDEPPFAPAAKGSITAFNRTNGERIWSVSTVTGKWVEGVNGTDNGGGTVWSGGSLDPATGVLYVPTGNAAPDFNPSTRPPPNDYTNSILAINATTGKILWHTQTTRYNTHDWDTAWGTSLANVTGSDGITKKVVIGQNKLGEAFALDAESGNVLWNNTLGVKFRIDADPQFLGSGTTWPGTQYGVEAYNANDGNTTYFAVSNMGFNFFKDPHGTSGHLVPAFDAIKNGLGNGTVTAIDIKSGKIKWTFPTEFPTWASPLVTNGLVFSGHVTDTGKPYEYNDFGAPSKTPLISSGVIFALDKDTGKKLWEFNVGAPVGIGGPSVGHGMLFVTTGSPSEISSNMGGYIIAFGLPSNATNIPQQQQQQPQNATSTSLSSTSQAQNQTQSHQPYSQGNTTATTTTAATRPANVNSNSGTNATSTATTNPAVSQPRSPPLDHSTTASTSQVGRNFTGDRTTTINPRG